MTNKTQHIALYGGAFDPPHTAHEQIVKYLATMSIIDRIHIIPYHQSPFSKTPMAAASDRIAMLHLLFDRYDQCHIDEHETLKKGISYTVDTVQHYQQAYPHAKLILVLSTESLASFMKWKHPEMILASCHIICFQRQGEKHIIPDHCQALLTEKPDDLIQHPSGKVLYLKESIPELSSSTVRDDLLNHSSLNGAVNNTVLAYIQQHQLYTTR